MEGTERIDPADRVVSWGPHGRTLTRREDDAIGVVARHVAADLLERVGEQWESWPEIGEHDWEDIVDRVGRMVRPPESDEYHRAYALLEARAGGDA